MLPFKVYLTKLPRDDPNAVKRDYSKEAVDFFKQKLEQYGNAEVPLKSLLGHRSQAAPEIRHVSGQNAKEFRDFLCKYPDVFCVRDDYIVLQSVLDKIGNSNGNENEMLTRLPEETPFDPYLSQQFIQLLESEITKLTPQYYKITVDILFNHIKNKFGVDSWGKIVKNANDLNTFLKMNSKIFLVQSNFVSLINEKKDQQKTQLTNNNGTSKNTSPESSSVVSTPMSSPSKEPSRVNSANSFHQRIRSQIIKAVSDNTNSQRRYNKNISTNNSVNNNSEATILSNTRIITKTKIGDSIINDIIENKQIIAVDCEGVNLGVKGTVTLVQIAILPPKDMPFIFPKIYLFDVFINPEFLEGSLKKLLESEEIIKIIHDVRNDAAALYFQHGIILKNVFDTQVAHAVIQQQNQGKPAYKAKYISLNLLCESYGGPVNPKKDQLKKYYRKDQRFWSHRPLTDEMILYAAHDVYSLIPNVYLNVVKQIRPEYLPLLNQLNHEAIYSRINPDEIKQIRRQRKNDMEVTDLKQKLFNSDTKKVILSNREIRLLR